MADNVDFFSEERWEHSHQYQEIKRLWTETFSPEVMSRRSKEENDVAYQEYVRISRHLRREWMSQELEEWKIYWHARTSEEICSLIPNHPYKIMLSGYSRYARDVNANTFTPEEGHAQSDILAQAIVDYIYGILHTRIEKYGRIPTGGTLGNIQKHAGDDEVQMECADWAAGLYDVMINVIEKSAPSFEVEMVRKEGIIPKFSQHHWIRVLGPNGLSFVTIDPWPDGGRSVIPQAPRKSNGVVFWGRNKTRYGKRSGL